MKLKERLLTAGLITLVVVIATSAFLTLMTSVRATSYVSVNLYNTHQPVSHTAGTPAYQVLVPNGVGSETELLVYPSGLQTESVNRDNWLAVQSPQGLDVPVGQYTYDVEGDPIAVDKYSGEVRVDFLTDNLVITTGTLSQKAKYNIEVTTYTLYGGKTLLNPKKQWETVTELRAKFQSYVYGSGSDLYQLENTPQNQEANKREIREVRIHAVVEGIEAGDTASTRIQTNGNRYNGTTVPLSSHNQSSN